MGTLLCINKKNKNELQTIIIVFNIYYTVLKVQFFMKSTVFRIKILDTIPKDILLFSIFIDNIRKAVQ